MFLATAPRANLNLASFFKVKSYHLRSADIAFSGALEIGFAMGAAETGDLTERDLEAGLYGVTAVSRAHVKRRVLAGVSQMDENRGLIVQLFFGIHQRFAALGTLHRNTYHYFLRKPLCKD